MPELPEVETVCRGLSKALTGSRFTGAKAHRADLRMPLPKNLAARLVGRRVENIERCAKYILIRLDKGETLLMHLGMSGRMVVTKKAAPPGKHDHLVFSFSNGAHVRFNDPRRFGMCDLVADKDLSDYKLLRHLGVEPLEKDLTPEFLISKFKSKKTPIKIALLDQTIVVGIGNIYASESLFYAEIDPRKLAGRCSRAELTRLIPSIRKVLNAAIKAGGSSLRNYVRADGELGYFQHQFAVYGREGERCAGCVCDIKKTGGVRRITQGGRSSFYCPVRQS